ncbi:MAG: hypothetical protein JST39_02465 [Bacteroidetes bacterium]|nr:hypothetical protein [Bacteroidota bacterium]
MKSSIYPVVIRIMIALLVAILPALTVLAQPGADSLQQQFLRYRQNTFQEKIFVHSNKTVYLAGETAWFKVYAVDGYLHQPDAVSSVANVEVVDKDRHAVLQARISLQEGSGAGSFFLPSSLPSGHYLLRAYTSWMKNFSPDFFFEQSITIINTLRAPGLPSLPSAPQYSIQFFPEGGNLVNGLASRTAFKLTDRYGRPAGGSGVIIGPRKDTVARFETGHAGMGSFVWTPKAGEAYTAKLQMTDTVIEQRLPDAWMQGYVIRLTEKEDNAIQVAVTATNGFAGTPVYLLAHTRQLLKFIREQTLSSGGTTVFSIDKALLDDGVSQFTLFDAERRPVCERLYFKRPAKTLVIRARDSAAGSYGPRKKITIAVEAEESAGHPVPADLSMSVFMLDSLQPLSYIAIDNYLLLSSEIKGYIDDPGYYFKDSTMEGRLAADHLMLTQGWRRFRWEQVLQEGKPLFDYLPEHEGPVIQGKVTDKRSGMPAAGKTAWLSVPGADFVLSTAGSRANGDVYFNATPFYGHNEIIVQTHPINDSGYRVDIVHPYSDKSSSAMIMPFRLLPQWKGDLESRSIDVQAENSYRQKEKERYVLPAWADTTAFYGLPDKQYFLDDYTRFTTMEEVMREYVAEVKVRRQSGRFSFRAESFDYKSFFDDDPLVLLDGVPVFDLNKLMALDPLRIKKMEIIARKYYYGGLIADGIVSYKTYNGDLGGYQLDPNAVVVEYDGLQREREFYAPVYETPEQINSRLPDMRNALYWEPHIKTGSAPRLLSFYSGDLKGRFAVVLQGISGEGLSGTKVFTFDVH